MQILDSTLREGEQTAGVSFTLQQKIQIAKLLDDFGIDIIELGNPAISKNLENTVKVLSSEKLNAETLAHCRAVKEDIDLAIHSNADWAGIFMATSDISINAKYSFTKEQAIEKVSFAIDYAKQHGLKVRYTLEDGTRAEYNYALKMIDAAKDAKADRISIADTVGIMTPTATKELFSNLIRDTKMDFNVHCHNDFGLATANSLAAFEGGVKLADCCVNGLGERAGITPLSELVVSLSQLYKIHNGWKLDMLPEISETVRKYSGITMSQNAPIVGENAFAHKAGLHTSAVLKDPRSYEAFPPQLVNANRKIIVDQYASKAALRDKLSKLNIEIDNKSFDKAFCALKESRKRWITDADIVEIVQNSMQLQLVSETPVKVEAIITIYTDDTASGPTLSKRILFLPCITKVFEISGEGDIIVIAEANSVSELNEIIDKINTFDGIKKTDSKIVMRELHAKNNN